MRIIETYRGHIVQATRAHTNTNTHTHTVVNTTFAVCYRFFVPRFLNPTNWRIFSDYFSRVVISTATKTRGQSPFDKFVNLIQNVAQISSQNKMYPFTNFFSFFPHFERAFEIFNYLQCKIFSLDQKNQLNWMIH